MKKLLLIFIALALCCALLIGCGKKKDDTPRDPSTEQGSQTGNTEGTNSSDNGNNPEGGNNPDGGYTPDGGDTGEIPDIDPIPDDPNQSGNTGTNTPTDPSPKPDDVVDPPATDTQSTLSFKLNADGSGYEVNGIGECRDSNITIPKKYMGLPVTGIADGAFKDIKSIKSVSIADSVVTIGESAFEGCSGITSLTVPSSVKTIGKKAFYDCKHLVSVTVGKAVQSIGEDAFVACNKLIEVINRSSLDITKGSSDHGSVAEYALEVHSNNSKVETQSGYLFYIYDGLAYLVGYTGKDTSLFLPSYKSSNYHIYPYAFYDMDGITSVSIHSSVLSIGDFAFCGCTSMSSVSYSNVSKIGNSAFRDCTSLAEFTFQSVATSVGDSVLAGCTSLKSVWISGNITYLGDNMLRGCTSLEKVTLMYGIQNISEGAFNGCSSLTEISIPSSVVTIGPGAFTGCDSLISKENGIYYVDKWVIGCDSTLTSLEFRSNTVGVAASAFKGLKITSAILPDTVYAIGNTAFDGCENLTEVLLSPNLIKIGYKIFSGCKALEYVFYGAQAANWSRITKSQNDGLDDMVYMFSSEAPLEYGRFWHYEYDYESEKTVMEKWPEIYSEGLEYVLTYGYYTVAGIGSCKDTDIVIPQFYNGTEVMEIGRMAFANLTTLKSITLPCTVIYLGDSAFLGCTSLESISIPMYSNYYGNLGAYSGIGEYVFEGCNIKNAKIHGKLIDYIGKDDLETVEITAGRINSGDFSGCYELQSVIISKNVEYVGAKAFNSNVWQTVNGVSYVDTWVVGYDYYASYADIRYGTVGIVDYAFNNSGITQVYIPETVRYISDNSFINCSQLTYIEVHEYNEMYTSIDGNLYGNNSSTLIRYAQGKTDQSFTLPKNVRKIGGYAFYGSAYLEEVNLSESIIQEISSYAFNSCSNLRYIDIPNTVKYIGGSAFARCSSLTSVIIGYSVSSIGEAAFANSPSLMWFDASEYNDYYMSLDGNLYTKDGKTLVQYAIGKGDTEFSIPVGVEKIGRYAFDNSQNLDRVLIPGSVTLIDSYAFTYSSIREVTVPDSVKRIEYDSFYNCDRLESVVIGNGVTAIGSGAFYDCDSLTNVVIGKGVTSIGSGAFYDCDSLTGVTIPDNVTSIDSGAFANCDSLTNVAIGNGVTSIGSGAFTDCGNLVYNEYENAYYLGNENNSFVALIAAKDQYISSCTVNNTTKVIADAAFYGCESLVSIVIPDSVTNIGNSAFYGCESLTGIVIGKGVTSIGDSAFFNCQGLLSITVDANNKYYKDIDGNLYTKDGKTLLQYATGKGDTEFSIPVGVEKIGQYAFHNTQNLDRVLIPGSVTVIDSYAFAYSSILDVTVPDSVKRIEYDSFYSCDRLESVVIGDGVTDIASGAFSDCDNLTNVVIGKSVTNINGYAFHYCLNLANVYYTGTADEWSKVTLAEENKPLLYATVYYYSEKAPVQSGSFWHYVDGEIAVW